MYMSQFIPLYITFVLFIIWVLVWKAISVWRAAGRKDKKWFIILFIFNTAGILELVYLFRIVRKPMYLWLIGVSLALIVILLMELVAIAPSLPPPTY